LINRDDALSKLRHGNVEERIHAARAIGLERNADDIEALLLAKRVEADAVVRIWIERAIVLCSEKADARDDGEQISFDRAVHRAAIEWVTGVLLHEMVGKLGLLRLHAEQEFEHFSGSKTAKFADALASILEGIEELQGATKSASQEEFDLAGFLEKIAEVENAQSDVEVLVVGTRPSLVYGVPRLLGLAVRNGMRNAIEASIKPETVDGQLAVKDAGASGKNPVVVTWGLTDTDCWVSIVDTGVGLIGSQPSIFDIGHTTKNGHLGFGLAIAKQAMETLDGSIELKSSPSGGAVFAISWQRTL